MKAPRRSSTGAVKRKMPAANENKASGKKAKPAGNGAKKKPAKKAKKGESATPLRAVYRTNHSCASCRAAAHMLNQSSSLFCLQHSNMRQSRG